MYYFVEIIKTSFSRYTENPLTHIYIKWHSFDPELWNRETLKGLTERTHLICSTKGLLNSELTHSGNIFCSKN